MPVIETEMIASPLELQSIIVYYLFVHSGELVHVPAERIQTNGVSTRFT